MFVKVLTPLSHDGERLKPDDVIEIDDKQAKSLIADKVVEKTTKPTKADKAPEGGMKTDG